MPSKIRLSRLAKFILLKSMRHPSSQSYSLKNLLKVAVALMVLSPLIMMEVNLWVGIVCLGIGTVTAIHTVRHRLAERAVLSSPEYQAQMQTYLRGESDELPDSRKTDIHSGIQ